MLDRILQARQRALQWAIDAAYSTNNTSDHPTAAAIDCCEVVALWLNSIHSLERMRKVGGMPSDREAGGHPASSKLVSQSMTSPNITI